MKDTIRIFKSKFLVACGTLIFSLTGCQDYLHLEDTGSISADNFPTSLEHVNLLVSSAYGAQHHWEFMGHFWAGYLMYCLEHTADQQWRNDQPWTEIQAGTISTGNKYVTGPWKALSMGVYYSNVALDGANKYRELAKPSEVQALDNYEGEALFFRAYYRWHMLTLYGQPDMDGVGIPLINEPPATMEAMQVPREKTATCYQAIIDDLEKAAALLVGQTDNHRVTEWSAKAFLAKAYLFVDNKEKAKTFLEDCIHNSGKYLEPYDRYKMMFNGYDEYEYNNESFYEMGNKADPDRGNAYGALNTGTSLSILYAPFCINPKGDRVAMCYSNQFMHDRNLARFGYTDPAPLSQLEPTGNPDEPYKLKDSYMAQQRKHRELLGREENGPDPRLFVCALQPFVDTVKMKIDGVSAPRTVAQCEFGKWWQMEGTGNDPQTFYGWPLRKYQWLDGHMTSETRNVAGYNIYFQRLPDIYLMYAEIMKDSDPNVALEYINKVKRRAYGYPVDSPSPVDYKSLTDRTKTVDPEDHLANNPLLYERWAETFGEMNWWEHVRRLRLGKQEYSFYKTICGPGLGFTNLVWSDKTYAMPIPALELEGNPHPGMVQTPGY